MQKDIKGHELVSGVLHEWKSIVNRVARLEKMIACRRAAIWFDGDLKDKISLRREVYKNVIRGREGLWYVL